VNQRFALGEAATGIHTPVHCTRTGRVPGLEAASETTNRCNSGEEIVSAFSDHRTFSDTDIPGHCQWQKFPANIVGNNKRPLSVSFELMKFDVQAPIIEASNSPDKRIVCLAWSPDAVRLAIATTYRVTYLFRVSDGDLSKFPVKGRDESANRAFTITGPAGNRCDVLSGRWAVDLDQWPRCPLHNCSQSHSHSPPRSSRSQGSTSPRPDNPPRSRAHGIPQSHSRSPRDRQIPNTRETDGGRTRPDSGTTAALSLTHVPPVIVTVQTLDVPPLCP
jgi:hypothetical protein